MVAMEELVKRKKLLGKFLTYMTKLPESKVNCHSFGPADSPCIPLCVFTSLICHCCSMKMVTSECLF